VKPRDVFMCPWCRTEFPEGPMAMCAGPFLDGPHPSAVRPILVEVDPETGVLLDGQEERLAESKATYRPASRGGAGT
jgi:hypothetical protein